MYNTKEAAELYRVHPQTLRRYTRLPDKPLRGIKVNLRGDLEFRKDDLIEFARMHDITVLEKQPQ